MEFDTRYDTSGYLATLRSKATLLETGLNRARDLSFPDYDRIIIMGMGGSGIAGRLLKRYLPREPIDIVSDYDSDLPITSRTIIFVCSYSGNTEEAISYYQKVVVSNAHLIVITTGGQLGELARSKRIPTITMPQGLEPRVSALAMLFALIRTFANSGVRSADDHTHEAIRALSNDDALDTMERYAKSLAAKIDERTPLIYATQNLREVAYLWKTNFNENSKIHAFMNVIPELCHNELNAFTHPEEYYVIFLNDESDPRRIKQRTDVLRDLLGRRGFENSTIMVKGPNTLTKMINTIHLSELTSAYLALGHHVDPADVSTIEEFKKELSRKTF
jgi:glucose/mannose-6-phosphate isomerase